MSIICQSSENITAYHEYLTVTQFWDQRLSKEGPGNYASYLTIIFSGKCMLSSNFLQ